MYYTVEVNGTMKRKLGLLLGLVLAIISASCGSGATPPATPSDPAPSAVIPQNGSEAIPPSRDSSAPQRVPAASLPPICDCILRFDHISIEQGLSQS